MPVTLRSYSKINLGLLIGPARPDGFHALATVYGTLDAHDLVTVTVEQGGDGEVVLSSNDRRVPLDGRNTVAKMLRLALAGPEREGLRARVHIEKRLPVQGGLGAGSANAAAALLGLERELGRLGWAPPLSGIARLRMAAEVGSDVPLFLLGGCVFGLERGEQVLPLADGPGLPVVLALPDTGVSTPAAFRAWDAEQAANGLTPAAQAIRLGEFIRAVASAWTAQHPSGVFAEKRKDHAEGDPLATLVQTGLLTNDFEEVVFRQNPFLRQLKRALANSQAVYASLSGSGSAVFGVFADEAAALAAEHCLGSMRVRSLRSRLLGRAPYWSGMVVNEE